MWYSPSLATSLLLSGSWVLASNFEERDVGEHVGSKQVSCGDGVGRCGKDECCSLAGYCGKSAPFCESPGCQILFSNGNCDADAKPCGPGTENVARDNNGMVPYNVIIKACKNKGETALTFDDGPSAYTEEIMDVLDEYGAKGTFFVVGNNHGKGRIDDPETPWPKMLLRMYRSGHQIGSHSWSHLDLSNTSDELRERDVRYNEMALRNVLGVIPKYFRPPYGSCTRQSGCLDFLSKLGYHVVTWDLDTGDFDKNTPRKIQECKDTFDEELSKMKKEKVKEEFKGNWRFGTPNTWDSPKVLGNHIVLAHDTHEQTARNLTVYMLRQLERRGIKAVTLAQCLGQTDTKDWYMDARRTPNAKMCINEQGPSQSAA